MTERRYLPDVNVLVAAHVARHQHHALAHRWLVETDGILLTPVTQSGLVRMLMNPAIGDLPRDDAHAVLRHLGSSRRATFLPDDTDLTTMPILTGWHRYRQTTDYHLLNLAAAHDAVLTTLDASFYRAVDGADRRHAHLLKP